MDIKPIIEAIPPNGPNGKISNSGHIFLFQQVQQK
jgi:hypothetical protein